MRLKNREYLKDLLESQIKYDIEQGDTTVLAEIISNFTDQMIFNWLSDENQEQAKHEEEKVSFTYSFLRRKIDWEQFCDLTGIDYYAKANGYEVKDNEIFYITESKAKQFNLI